MYAKDPILRLLFGPTFLLVTGIIICVEAIFIAESFTTIMEITIEFGGSALNALTLAALKAPEILDFGIPIALLVGIYFAVTQIREELAFVVCAAAGVSWVRIPVFAGSIGALGGVSSILLSGFVTPETRHMQRITVFDMQARQVTLQLERNSTQKAVQTIGGLTFISTGEADESGEGAKNLMVYFDSKGDNWHVSLADDWLVDGPDMLGIYRVTLLNFSDYVGTGRPISTGVDSADVPPDHSDPAGMILQDVLRAQSDGPRFSTLLVKSTVVEFQLDEVLGQMDELRRMDELILRDLTKSIGSEDTGSALRLLAEKLARALLCPFAALAALLAATAASGRKGRMTALPLAAIGLLGLDVVGRSALIKASASGVLMLAGGSVLLLLLTVLPVVALLYLLGERVILPFQDKTG